MSEQSTGCQMPPRTILIGQAHTRAERLIYSGHSLVTGWEVNRERRLTARQQIIDLAEQLKIEAAQGAI